MYRPSTIIFHLAIISSCFLFICRDVCAQALIDSTAKEFRLADGVRVMVFASADNNKQYYYLPLTLQLGISERGPEISMVFYKQGDDPAIRGGLLHFLMRWGLTTEQQDLATELLHKEVDSEATLVGAAEIEFPDMEQCEIVPGNAIADLLRRSATAAIRMPSLSTNKTAASFHFSAEDAAFLRNALRKPEQVEHVIIRSKYYYSISHEQDGVRTAKQVVGNMEASFKQWMDGLTKHDLLKTETL